MIRKKILVQGAVQGVGFRPFIYNLAIKLDLTGFITNTTTGVTIEAQGQPDVVARFITTITDDHPPLAQPEITHQETLILIETDSSFEIRSSQTVSERRASITPDAATCPDCLAELTNPSDRRFRYPFINCTNCGPRYTIVFDLPYDRKNTTMHHFKMCQLCQTEYDDPTHRRFHAQPNACPDCGPNVWLTDLKGQTVKTDDPIKQAVELLQAGKILAIKGLGGFHLAVRADHDLPVQHLRQRKYRKAMAFAIMVRDIQTANQIAEISPVAQNLLTDIARPIVLCPKKTTPVGWALSPPSLSNDVAPNSRFWGIMLPYTPLHTMIMQGDYPALVMTSGNTTDEPIENENESALTRLSG
ncbi:MAG: carbamoyltransferase HypF, partial [Planctomycetes bacterium]|nr:carbamoyltransferase HypF [Planctomycetota bacterium]